MSRIFSPFRVLGLCSSSVPFVVKYSAPSDSYYVLVPVGDTFNVYKLPRLTLVAVSDSLSCAINCFACSEQFTYAAAGEVIYVFRNLRHLTHTLRGHKDRIKHLHVLSGGFLVSVDDSSLLNVWDLLTYELVFTTSFTEFSFRVTVVAALPGYKYKVLLGSSQGPLQLWNVKSQKQLYWFKGFDSGVTCITPAPVMDVCAIGLANGKIVLHNIKYDTTLMEFLHDGGAITTIGFRSGSHGFHAPSNTHFDSNLAVISAFSDELFLVAGCDSGWVKCWLLKEDGESRPVGCGKRLHWACIVSMFCFPSGEAACAMVTSGLDNCLKVSYFDRPDGSPRTVYKRSGHSKPPNRIAFWPGGSLSGSLLLSAGQDSVLRIFSTYNAHMDKSLGRAYAPGAPDRRKSKVDQRSAWLLPGITSLACCVARAEEWDSVVAIHEGRRQATTWNFVNATRGRHWLDPEKFKGKGGAAVRMYKHTIATSVFVTHCGNYVLLGYSSGDAVKFNLQSGLEHGSYGHPTAHVSAVVGIAANHVNRQTVTVAGTEVRFWSFLNGDLLDTATLPSDALFSRFNGDNDTLAVPLTDGSIVLFDTLRRRVFRRFENPASTFCVDLAMSTDGRWLISAHNGDSLIKTWDILNGRLIDCFRVSAPITSVALSPSNEFLATTHANSPGIHLWDNRGTYRRLHLQPLANNFVPPLTTRVISVPSRSLVVSADGLRVGPDIHEDDLEGRIRELNEDSYTENIKEQVLPTDSYMSPEQLQDQLPTLSGLSSVFLSNFLHLDVIRERNRLAASNTESDAMSNLPFFLPITETAKGLAWVDASDAGLDVGRKQTPGKRRASVVDGTLAALEPVPGLGAQLVKATTDKEFDEIMRTLKTFGPSALDLEIRLLAPSVEEEKAICSSAVLMNDTPRERLHGFLRLLINRFERNMDVDLACVCLEGVLQRHGDLLLHPYNKSVEPTFHASGTLEQHLNELLSTRDRESNAVNSNATLSLVSHAILAKNKAANLLTRRLTRSICLIDFIRNPTTALHF